ncbi:hypothetical protein [Gracilibacillus massiliensis]|uniref:hypothetical protein n=1 Tax=Gracilibacillus massiliensis TaxID=1564956 RepID=UPI00071D266D|nr:hypothetical protein [Gracilibacillus massiliensis]
MRESKNYEESALLGGVKGKITEEMTVTQWDKIAHHYNYPSSARLIYTFGSWNAVKQRLGFKGNKRRYSEQELINIAQNHKKHFTSKRKWREYALNNDLPSELIYIQHFDSWNKAKEIVGEPLSRETNPIKYSKEDVTQIIKKNRSYFTSREDWDKYASYNKLPSYLTIKKYFSWEEVMNIAGVPVQYKYTEEELKKMLQKEHKKFLTSSIREWNEYAKDNHYPTSIVFIKRFKTWNQAKEAIEKMFK